jgi:hypothetical protein
LRVKPAEPTRKKKGEATPMRWAHASRVVVPYCGGLPMQITELLQRMQEGDQQALHTVIPLVYDELEKLAAGWSETLVDALLVLKVTGAALFGAPGAAACVGSSTSTSFIAPALNQHATPGETRAD